MRRRRCAPSSSGATSSSALSPAPPRSKHPLAPAAIGVGVVVGIVVGIVVGVVGVVVVVVHTHAHTLTHSRRVCASSRPLVDLGWHLLAHRPTLPLTRVVV
eukprot:3725318-Rhodomonas_salina.1